MVEARKDIQKIKEEDTMKVRLRNMDRFQSCLAVCRTSSASVRHENTYKDPHSKHCYTIQPPYNHQRHRRDIKSLNNNRDNDAVVLTSSSVVLLINLSYIFFLLTIRMLDNLKPQKVQIIVYRKVAMFFNYNFSQIT